MKNQLSKEETYELIKALKAFNSINEKGLLEESNDLKLTRLVYFQREQINLMSKIYKNIQFFFYAFVILLILQIVGFTFTFLLS